MFNLIFEFASCIDTKENLFGEKKNNFLFSTKWLLCQKKRIIIIKIRRNKKLKKTERQKLTQLYATKIKIKK